MEIRLQINDDFIESLKKDMGIKSTATITNEALTLLKWAVDEVRKGRKLYSSNEHDAEKKVVAMPSLEMAAQLAKKRELVH